MSKKLTILLLAFCLMSSAHAATIIWVSDNKAPTGGVAADQAWVDLLVAQGYEVNLDFRNQEGRNLNAVKIDALNAADLIIISRDSSSGSYDDGDEPTQWNSITTPILMQPALIARSDRWRWMDTTGSPAGQATLEVVLLNHPIFKGITLDENNQIDIITIATNFAETTDPGNGTLIGKRADNGLAWIVEWEEGQEFYPGSGQTAGGTRMLFSSGTDTGDDGRYNLTPEGEKLFLNAVAYLLGEFDSGPIALDPNPANGQKDVPRDAVLTWTPGELANTHDVYFGTVFNDVSDAGRTNPLGVLASQDQGSNIYKPGRLELEQTYYWRVDEVNAPPDSTIFKGEVWSFTTEPVGYAIENITATASSSEANQGPENTVNDSGLDESGLLHDKAAESMWLSSSTGPQPTWIEFEFDRVYRLHEMWVWNSNENLEALIGLGCRDVTIEYSDNGTDYTTLGTTHEFARAPAASGYAHNTTVDLTGVAAKFIRLTVNSNWGGLFPQYGLSEVRFFSIPVQAREPNPNSGATDLEIDVVLGFRTGREAAKHDVYISSDEQAVIDGNVPVTTVTENSYAPPAIDLGTTYYWRVDEVNDVETPATWQGDIWNFSTQEFLVVDDFEDYNELEPFTVYNTWTDGYLDTTNGSTIGYILGNPQETQTVHGGKQSVPIMYDNSVASFSEVAVNPDALAIGRDWNKGGAKTLVLWFHGDSANAVTEQMYMKINGSKVLYNGDASDISRPRWKQWNIDLAAFGTNLSNVTQLSIGFERTGASGSSGTVLIDDIRLYRVAPEIVVPSEEIWIEAELADTIMEPLKIFYNDPSASAGQYIGTDSDAGDSTGDPPAPFGTATYTLTVTGGTYKITGRINIPNSNNSFWVRIQGSTTPAETEIHSSGWVEWNDPPATAGWFWNDVFSNTDNEDATVLFTMPAGTYTLEIGYREAGALLDVLVISKID